MQQQDLVSNMRKWQKIENASVSSTSQIIEKTDNPIVRLAMEIILQDSQTHYRVQELIAGSIDDKALSLTSDELAEVWDMIERHIELERKTVELAEQAIAALKGQQGMVVQEYLLNYLLTDERKHNELLSALDSIKRGMYRSV
jgi:bacterioferritin (cytochrome b1)